MLFLVNDHFNSFFIISVHSRNLFSSKILIWILIYKLKKNSCNRTHLCADGANGLIRLYTLTMTPLHSFCDKNPELPGNESASFTRGFSSRFRLTCFNSHTLDLRNVYLALTNSSALACT